MALSVGKALFDVCSSYRKFQQNQLTASDCVNLAASTIFNASVFAFAYTVTPLLGNFTCHLTSGQCGSDNQIYNHMEIEGKNSKICFFNTDNHSTVPVS